MEIYQAIVLAIVQGLTEFLPISSSAHLILVPELLGWNANGLAFDVAVHVGTLFAVMAYLKREIGLIVPAWFSGWRNFKWSNDGLLGWWVVAATIPVGLIGLFAGDLIEQYLRSAMVIAIATLIFGLMLGWADRSGDKNNSQIESISLKHSLLVGAAQAIALIPGTSRSGITMTAMLALGYSRTAAAKFSFLLALPAIALPGLLKVGELASSQNSVQWDVMIVGVVVSAIVAFACIHWFIKLIERIGMRTFVIYRVILAGVIVAVLI